MSIDSKASSNQQVRNVQRAEHLQLSSNQSDSNSQRADDSQTSGKKIFTSDSNSDGELITEIRELSALVGRLATNHKTALERHETDILAAFKTCKRHAESLERLHQIVARQNDVLAALEQAAMKLFIKLGMEPPPELPPQDQKPN